MEHKKMYLDEMSIMLTYGMLGPEADAIMMEAKAMEVRNEELTQRGNPIKYDGVHFSKYAKRPYFIKEDMAEMFELAMTRAQAMAEVVKNRDFYNFNCDSNLED